MNKIFDNYYFILFSIIPISIIIGPAISLINIILIIVPFLFFLIYKKKFSFLTNPTVKLLLILYIYLLFNSFISVDPGLGLKRNLGFIRYIILFLAFNYFFYHIKNFQKIFLIWTIILLIVCFDVFYESIFGHNILGFGGYYYGNRITSFFKDEPVVGGFINCFFLVIIAYILNLIKIKPSLNLKYLFFTVFIILFVAIMLTGERSNTIKAFLGFLLFFLLIDTLSIKQKLLFLIVIFLTIVATVQNSDFLKKRFINQMIYFIPWETELHIDKNPLSRTNLYFDLYSSGYSVFKNNPIFGVGNKNYRVATCGPSPSATLENYVCGTHPAQIYFEIMSEHGVVGSLIFFSIFFISILKIYKNFRLKKNYIQLGSLIYVLVTFFPLLPGGSFFSDFNSNLFWLNFSIMFALSDKNIFNREGEIVKL